MVTWDNHPEQSPYRSGENRITMKLIIVMDNTLLIVYSEHLFNSSTELNTCVKNVLKCITAW